MWVGLRDFAKCLAYWPQLRIAGVMCSIAGAVGQATRGEDVRSSAGVACLRSNIAHNNCISATK